MKNTINAMIALFALAEVIASELKDGFQFQDVIDLITKLNSDDALKAKLKAGFDSRTGISSEFESFNFAKGIELAGAIYPLVQSLSASLKKQSVQVAQA